MIMETGQSRLWMLIGKRGVGKTVFCAALVQLARHEGWQVGGLLTPAIFTGDLKTGILVENLETGETRPLASLDQTASFDLQVGKWHFDRSVIDWGNQVIRDSLQCDLLIIDEYGPLELLRHEGWWASVDVINSRAYSAALLVVRPELETLAHRTLNTDGTICLDDARQTDQLVSDLWSKISSRYITPGKFI